MSRAFRRAARHSRRVRRLRYGLPAGAVLTLCGFVLVSWLNPLRALQSLPGASLDKLVISGTKVRMEAPRLAGFTSDARAYEMTAQAAAQDLLRPDVIELTEVYAKVEMQDKSLVTVTARDGLYDAKADRLTLRERIVIVSSTGYEGRLSEAVIDVRKGEIASDKPVKILMPNGNLDANKLELTEGGQLVRFTGGVSMVMNGDESAKASGQGQPGTENDRLSAASSKRVQP